MADAGVTKTINAPSRAVWTTLRRFDGTDSYLPAVTSYRIEGNEVGARRYCTLEDGMKPEETLEYVNDDEQVLKYSIDNGISPFEDYLGTITVRAAGEKRTEVNWNSRFTANDVPEQELVTMVKQMLAVAIDGLEKLHAA